MSYTVGKKSCSKHSIIQRVLILLAGWLSVLGWQTSVASTAYLSGTYVQSLLILNYDWYVSTAWQGTLFVIAIACFAGMFNIFLAKHLPLIEGLILVLHIFGFFGIIVPLWVLSPRASSSDVWGGFYDPGWGSAGLASFVGILSGILPLLGADAAGKPSSLLIGHISLISSSAHVRRTARRRVSIAEDYNAY